MYRPTPMLCASFSIVAAVSCPSIVEAGYLVGTRIGSNTLISIDPISGSWNNIGPIGLGVAMNGLAYDSVHDILYGVDTSVDLTFRINPFTGAGTPIGPFNNPANGNASGLEYDPINSTLWGCDPDSNRIFSVNVTNGNLSNGVVVQGFTGLEGLAMDVEANILYALADGQDRIIRVDPFTGTAIALPNSLGQGTWRGLAFDPEQRLLYAIAVNPTSRLYRVDPATGSATFISDLGNGSVQGLAYIPSPATLLTFLIASVASPRRRRQ